MNKVENGLERFIFFSRWFQAPLYLGLIVGSIIYSIKFFIELVDMFAKFGLTDSNGIMLALLGLVDSVMVINLMTVVIIGGYWTFVSKIDILNDEDKPDWLVKINANTLKIKLVVALVSISSIHLLEIFINGHAMDDRDVIIRIVVHMVFVFSALLLAVTDRIMSKTEH